MKGRLQPHRGSVLLLTFLVMLVVAGLVAAVGWYAQSNLQSARAQWLDRRAFAIAEAGWQRARQALAAETWVASVSPGNTYTESFGGGEYTVTIVASNACTSSCDYTITASAYIPNQANAIARRQLVETDLNVTVTSGTNYSLAVSTIASASSSNGTNLPALAKDGLSATKWQSGTNGSGSWLAMDYGSATTLDRIIVKEDANITNLTIEWSDDGAVWNAPTGLAVSNSGKTWTANFGSTSHRYFRSRFTGVPSGRKAAVKESESYNISISLATGDVTTVW
jgi:Tfp pilus assembly protein PilX